MEAKGKLLDQVRRKLRAKHYSYRTEQQYIAWIRRFILHHGKRHPRQMSGAEVEHFLTHLAVDRKVAASTQNQALAAILFLYRQVLQVELPWLDDVVRAKRPDRLPVVLPAKDVNAILDHLEGQFRLIGQFLYGGGLRLMEALRLRIKDIDFDYMQIIVRDGKGKKDRVTVLPEVSVTSLRMHLERVRDLHDAALRRGYAGVQLPSALERKYASAHREWSWQYVFPAARP